MTIESTPVANDDFRSEDYSTIMGRHSGLLTGMAVTVPVDSTAAVIGSGSAVIRGVLARIPSAETVSVPLTAGRYFVVLRLNALDGSVIPLVLTSVPTSPSDLPIAMVVRASGAATVTAIAPYYAGISYRSSVVDVPPGPFAGVVVATDMGMVRSSGSAWVSPGDTGWRTDSVAIGSGFGAISSNLTKWRIRQGEATVEVRVRRVGGDFYLSQNGDVGGDITLVQLPGALQRGVQAEGVGSVRNPGATSGWTVGVRMLPSGEVQLLDGIPGGVILTGGEVTATVKFTADRG